MLLSLKSASFKAENRVHFSADALSLHGWAKNAYIQSVGPHGPIVVFGTHER